MSLFIQARICKEVFEIYLLSVYFILVTSVPESVSNAKTLPLGMCRSPVTLKRKLIQIILQGDHLGCFLGSVDVKKGCVLVQHPYTEAEPLFYVNKTHGTT